MECDATFYLDLTTENIISQCGACDITSTKAIIIDNLDGRVNICVDRVYAYTLKGGSITTMADLTDATTNWRCTHIARVNITKPGVLPFYEVATSVV